MQGAYCGAQVITDNNDHDDTNIYVHNDDDYYIGQPRYDYYLNELQQLLSLKAWDVHARKELLSALKNITDNEQHEVKKHFLNNFYLAMKSSAFVRCTSYIEDEVVEITYKPFLGVLNRPSVDSSNLNNIFPPSDDQNLQVREETFFVLRGCLEKTVLGDANLSKNDPCVISSDDALKSENLSQNQQLLYEAINAGNLINFFKLLQDYRKYTIDFLKNVYSAIDKKKKNIDHNLSKAISTESTVGYNKQYWCYQRAKEYRRKSDLIIMQRILEPSMVSADHCSVLMKLIEIMSRKTREIKDGKELPVLPLLPIELRQRIAWEAVSQEEPA